MLKEMMNMKEAVEEIGVEAHVLRYWEEELKLPIQRSSKGRRYYVSSDIETFIQIKDWKEEGLSLKEIRGKLGTEGIYEFNGLKVIEHTTTYTQDDKAQRLQLLLKQFITESMQASLEATMQESNKVLVTEIKESLVKEMDYQFRAQEERESQKEKERLDREEEHYKQIDELLRIVSIKGKRKKHSIF